MSFLTIFFTSMKLMDDLLAQDTSTVRCNHKDLPPCAKNKLWQGEKDTIKETFLSCLPMFCLAKPHALFNEGRTGTISILKSPMLPMFTQQTWVALTEPTSFICFILLVFLQENGTGTLYIFWFLFNLSVCNGFILESIYRSNEGKRKRPMISFRLDLAKQLIDGFNKRKRKQRSPWP